jgi:GAT domain
VARTTEGSHRDLSCQLCRTCVALPPSPRSHIVLQEPLPEPTAAELTAEAQQEAAIFAQAANVDRLLTMLRSLDPAKDSLADNEEIQELYRSCMTLRPKIVKLIDKYSQKRGV